MRRRIAAVSFVLVVLIAGGVTTAVGQSPAVVPPNLQTLEQKMAQIRFNTARISSRAVLDEIGPVARGAELGAGVKGSNTLVISTIAGIRLLPPASTSASKVEGQGMSESTLGKGHHHSGSIAVAERIAQTAHRIQEAQRRSGQ